MLPLVAEFMIYVEKVCSHRPAGPPAVSSNVGATVIIRVTQMTEDDCGQLETVKGLDRVTEYDDRDQNSP